MSLLVRAQVSGELRGIHGFAGLARKALAAAVQEAAGEIEAKGRADISGAGNFGARWTLGFKAEVSGEGSDDVHLDVTMAVPYWTVFQFGATIQGRPLLFFKPTKAVGGLAGRGNSMPLLISKHSVSIPKKFHLIEIAEREAERVPLLFKQNLAALAGASLPKD